MFGQFSTIAPEVFGFTLDYTEYENDGFEWTRRYLLGTPGWSGNLFALHRGGDQDALLYRHGVQGSGGMTYEYDTDMIRIFREALVNAVSNVDYWGCGGLVIEMHPGMVIFSSLGTFRTPVEEVKEGGGK